MIAVIQRVYNAEVSVNSNVAGKIGMGLYILLGVEKNDGEDDCLLLAEKIAKLRIFSDENGKMNLSVRDIEGEALVVSNFTLNATYAHGNRPDYLNSASPCEAERLYNHFIELLSGRIKNVETGIFGADMTTNMSTDGPVTIVMRSEILKRRKE